jgi:hypothetical protein
MPDQPPTSDSQLAAPVRPPQPVQSSEAPVEEDDEHSDNRSSKPLVALLFLVVLAIGGWLLVTHLMDANKMQDCVMSGRKNCAPIDTAGR